MRKAKLGGTWFLLLALQLLWIALGEAVANDEAVAPRSIHEVEDLAIDYQLEPRGQKDKNKSQHEGQHEGQHGGQHEGGGFGGLFGGKNRITNVKNKYKNNSKNNSKNKIKDKDKAKDNNKYKNKDKGKGENDHKVENVEFIEAPNLINADVFITSTKIVTEFIFENPKGVTEAVTITNFDVVATGVEDEPGCAKSTITINAGAGAGVQLGTGNLGGQFNPAPSSTVVVNAGGGNPANAGAPPQGTGNVGGQFNPAPGSTVTVKAGGAPPGVAQQGTGGLVGGQFNPAPPATITVVAGGGGNAAAQPPSVTVVPPGAPPPAAGAQNVPQCNCQCLCPAGGFGSQIPGFSLAGSGGSSTGIMVAGPSFSPAPSITYTLNDGGAPLPAPTSGGEAVQQPAQPQLQQPGEPEPAATTTVAALSQVAGGAPSVSDIPSPQQNRLPFDPNTIDFLTAVTVQLGKRGVKARATPAP